MRGILGHQIRATWRSRRDCLKSLKNTRSKLQVLRVITELPSRLISSTENVQLLSQPPVGFQTFKDGPDTRHHGALSCLSEVESPYPDRKEMLEPCDFLASPWLPFLLNYMPLGSNRTSVQKVSQPPSPRPSIPGFAKKTSL